MSAKAKTKKKEKEKFDPLNERSEFQPIYLNSDTLTCDAEYDKEKHGRKGKCGAIVTIDEISLNKADRKEYRGRLERSTIVFSIKCGNMDCPDPDGFYHKRELKMFDPEVMRLIPNNK